MIDQPLKAVALKRGEYWVLTTTSKTGVTHEFYEISGMSRLNVHFRSLDHRELVSMSITDALNYRIRFSDELQESIGEEWIPLYHAEYSVQQKFCKEQIAFSSQLAHKRPIELGGAEGESIPGQVGWLGRDLSTWEQVKATWKDLSWLQRIGTFVFAGALIYLLSQFLIA